MKGLSIRILAFCYALSWPLVSLADEAAPVVDEEVTVARENDIPDLRGSDIPVGVEKGNLVVVPIPMSGPTLETGLILGEAYFHAQTEEEAKKQPASVTGAAGMYTGSDSKALAVAHQGYWKDDTWRFTVAAGAADLSLSLNRPTDDPALGDINWGIKGNFAYLNLQRKIGGNWFAGALARYINAEQRLDYTGTSVEFDLSANVIAKGIGAVLEYDTRDMPTNSYSGRHFKVEGVFNQAPMGNARSYQSYKSFFRSYHQMSDQLVLAWEFKGCSRGGDVPLWEGCMLSLRGFSATDYIGRGAVSSQAEARWHFSERWGVVGFAGAGYLTRTFSDLRENTVIPSYGVGVRFMVLPVKRINIRVDYGRSTGSDAVHLSVSEAF